MGPYWVNYGFIPNLIYFHCESYIPTFYILGAWYGHFSVTLCGVWFVGVPTLPFVAVCEVFMELNLLLLLHIFIVE